jgi:hypothetical protein
MEESLESLKLVGEDLHVEVEGPGKVEQVSNV